jgi:hypothetical protein
VTDEEVAMVLKEADGLAGKKTGGINRTVVATST